MDTLISTDVPAVYRLGFDEGALVLHIEPRAWRWLRSSLAKRRPTALDTPYGTQVEFILPGPPAWGYGRGLHMDTDGRDGGWVEMSCPLPAIADSLADDGDWTAALAASASLQTVFTYLMVYAFDNELAPSGRCQLLEIQAMGVGFNNSGSAVRAAVSRRLAGWMATQYPDNVRVHLATVTAAMSQAYGMLFPGRDHGLEGVVGGIEAAVNQHGLFLMCTGNASDLSPDWTSSLRRPVTVGHFMISHNIDTPAQQLTLLAGLGAFWDIAHQTGADCI
jgi:hypothetical protein